MKTKLQKRSEALKRRLADLSSLELLEKVHEDMTMLGYDDYVSYGRYNIFVTGAMPSNDDEINENRSALIRDFPDCVVLDADGFFARKKKAAALDIENLKKKLEGYHG